MDGIDALTIGPAVVALLFELRAQQKPFEFILPREGPLYAEP
jgi:hypothetical protein